MNLASLKRNSVSSPRFEPRVFFYRGTPLGTLHIQARTSDNIRVHVKHVLDYFQETKYYYLQNLSRRFILNYSLKFRKIQSRYFYKTYSYKKEKVFYE